MKKEYSTPDVGVIALSSTDITNQSWGLPEIEIGGDRSGNW